MSVHMALTGLRGSFAPFLGYAILVSSSPLTVAIIGSLLILISILMFEQYKNHPRLANNGN